MHKDLKEKQEHLMTITYTKNFIIHQLRMTRTKNWIEMKKPDG